MGPLPRRGLTCILIVVGEFLLLSMLDDLVFHDPGLVTAHELFPEFREAFLAGSPYEDIFLDRYDVRKTALVDGAEVECNFLTDPQDEWDDYSEAYMWIRVKPTD